MEPTTVRTSSVENQRPTYLPKNDTAKGFPPHQTALLIIDPVNDFLSEGGAAWDLTKSTVEKHDVIGNLKRVIEGARAGGIPVLFGPMAYTEEDYTTHQLQRRSGINRMMFERKMFLAGSWGADFHPDLQPAPGDIILLPHKSCDVCQTDLLDHLERLGTTHLVIAGMIANLCCESTGRQAMEKGFDVTFIADAIGAESLPAYEAAVLVNFPLIANAVFKTKEFLDAIAVPAGQAVPVREGDTMRGSDHLEIGTIKEVVAPADGTEGYLLIPQGLIFQTDSYVPLDAVVKKVGADVFINVPSIVFGKMPWSVPPTTSGRQSKQGPREHEVEKLYGSRSPSAETSGG